MKITKYAQRFTLPKLWWEYLFFWRPSNRTVESIGITFDCFTHILSEGIAFHETNPDGRIGRKIGELPVLLKTNTPYYAVLPKELLLACKKSSQLSD